MNAAAPSRSSLRRLPRLLGVWFLMLLVSVLNGALRDFSYGPMVGELLAHQLSTLSGLLLLGGVMLIALRRQSPASDRQALGIGLFWCGLTLAFEFLFFHYVGGHSWAVLLANYDLSAGRIWVLIPLWLLIAPLVFQHWPRQQKTGGR